MKPLSPIAIALAAICHCPKVPAQCPLTIVEAELWPPASVFELVTCALDGDRVLLGLPNDSRAGYLAGAAAAVRLEGPRWVREGSLLPPADPPELSFGIALALSGDTAIVGHPKVNFTVGAAIVYRLDAAAPRWSVEATLMPSDGKPGDYFGAVALEGDVAVIGASSAGDACGPPEGCPTGKAYVFRRTGSSWSEEAVLLPADLEPGDRFGSAAINGELIAIGARGADGGAGAVYVFRKVAGRWLQEAKIVASDAAPLDRFGTVAVHGDRIIVGADLDDDRGTSSGAAYLFRRGVDAWVEEAKLLPSDGAPFDVFGSAVAIGDGVAIVGAPGSDAAGSRSGAAYVFRLEGSTPRWVEAARLLPACGQASQRFGSSISISGRRAAVALRELCLACTGAPAAAQIYDLDTLGGTDCDGDGTCDAIQFARSPELDCNRNGALDACDIAAGTSTDCNHDGVPDECQVDCNGNGLHDECEIPAGRSDCDSDGVPDECETPYALDDGTAETVIGAGTPYPLDRLWLNGFEVRPGAERIGAVRVAWTACRTPEMLPLTVLVYDDPDNDGDPIDAVLLARASAEVPQYRWPSWTSRFVDVSIAPTRVGKAGERFFVGALVTSGGYFQAFDNDSPYRRASWSMTALAGEADVEDLAGNPVPPHLIDSTCCEGNWLVRAVPAAAPGCLCPADIDGDCVVGPADAGIIIDSWGRCRGPREPCPGDLDADGAVGIVDLLIVLGAWAYGG